MYKLKVTQKQIKNNYKNVISVGYCNLWHLLRGQEPKYYTSGVYGWNSDIYEIDYNTVIVTGYRPFGNVSNYELDREYNEKARKILENRDLKYDTKNEKINDLLNEYVDKILNK